MHIVEPVQLIVILIHFQKNIFLQINNFGTLVMTFDFHWTVSALKKTPVKNHCMLVTWYLQADVKQRKQMRTIVLLSIRLYLRTEEDPFLSISCLREQPLSSVCLLLKSPLSLNNAWAMMHSEELASPTLSSYIFSLLNLEEPYCGSS